MLAPASVTKLWTTAAAFDLLGADFKFVTKVYSSAALTSQGELNGNLQVLCGGDPLFEQKNRRDLGRPAMNKLADELHARGLRKVSGDIEIIANRSKRSCGNGVWEMGDLREGFAPAVDAAGYNSNVCHVAIHPGGAAGDTALVVLDPPFAPIAVRNSVVTTSGHDESWVEFNVTPCRDELELTGQMSIGDDPQYIWFPIQDPALYWGLALRDALAAKGISANGIVRVTRDANSGPNLLVEFSSPPLTDIASIVNKESDNYLAEYLLSAIGQKVFGTNSTEAGLRGVLRYARDRGITRDKVSLQDGCGLSRQNIVSAEAVVKLLSAMTKSDEANEFEASLAQSGVDGTIGGRLSTDGLMGRVHAKTGTIANVSALAGYIALDSGKRVAFAMICNNFRCSRNFVRNTQDELVRLVFQAAN